MKKFTVHHQSAVSKDTISVTSFLIMHWKNSIKFAFILCCIYFRQQFFYFKPAIILKLATAIHNRNADFRWVPGEFLQFSVFGNMECSICRKRLIHHAHTQIEFLRINNLNISLNLYQELLISRCTGKVCRRRLNNFRIGSNMQLILDNFGAEFFFFLRAVISAAAALRKYGRAL